MKAYVIDTESTGLPKEGVQPEVIELAYAEVLDGGHIGPIFEQRYLPPTQAITFGAMGTHHIIPSDLEGKPSSATAKLPDDCKVVLGHNVEFDYNLLGRPGGVYQVCTLTIARRIWDDEDNHSLAACLYRILPHAIARQRLQGAHGAAVDVRNAYILFKHFRAIKPELITWKQWIEFSDDCKVPRRWTFGKHRGSLIGQENGGRADAGYHAWAMKRVDMDPYVIEAIRRYREGTL